VETALEAHRQALWTEAVVAGGMRLDDEARSRPPGVDPTSASPGSSYEVYYPYQMGDGTIQAVVFRMEGRTILSSDIVTFRSLDAYHSAVPA